jgi:hypothetical protein
VLGPASSGPRHGHAGPPGVRRNGSGRGIGGAHPPQDEALRRDAQDWGATRDQVEEGGEELERHRVAALHELGVEEQDPAEKFDQVHPRPPAGSRG